MVEYSNLFSLKRNGSKVPIPTNFIPYVAEPHTKGNARVIKVRKSGCYVKPACSVLQCKDDKDNRVCSSSSIFDKLKATYTSLTRTLT